MELVGRNFIFLFVIAFSFDVQRWTFDVGVFAYLDVHLWF